jgi:predicted RNA-binding Zn-ribbon protein involved in translation (DUF1610 family)
MNKRYKYHKQQKVRVRCGPCNEWIDEQETEFINIEEDIQGADMLTFKCPICGNVSKSRRYGG